MNLANTLLELRDYRGACELYEQAIEMSSRINGGTDVVTIDLMGGLVISKRGLGERGEAKRLMREVNERKGTRFMDGLRRRPGKPPT